MRLEVVIAIVRVVDADYVCLVNRVYCHLLAVGGEHHIDVVPEI